MGKSRSFFCILLILGMVPATGCSLNQKLLPAHDEVLIYPLPYDLTYLRTMEALETFSEWAIEETEKEKGILRARNVHYSSLDDADKRLVTLLIKRVSRRETSIALAPESQRVLGAEKIMERVAQFLSREV